MSAPSTKPQRRGEEESAGAGAPGIAPETGLFPEDFVFGAATSAYQVEGGIENDWTRWERLGKLKDPSQRCGRACEHWERFYDDVALIKGLGLGAYRLSLEWARLEPQPGRWDDGAWQGYRDRLTALRTAGVRPVVTLHHFTHPAWFHERSPWHEASSLETWERFVRRCAELLEGLDAAVVTFNEPNVYLLCGYLAGLFPPGLLDWRAARAATENVLRAHAIAADVLGAERGRDVGIAQHMGHFAPRWRWSPIDRALAAGANDFFNHGILEALSTGTLRMGLAGYSPLRTKIDGAAGSMRFVGVNYYTRFHLHVMPRPPFVAFGFADPHARGLTDLGWEDFPEGLSSVLLEARRYGLPVWITENGIDDRLGARRPRFLVEHLREVLRARTAGVPVAAYFHWSLMDNFEWLDGWGPRFGLYRVDFDTLERTPTAACETYRQVVRTRRLPPPP